MIALALSLVMISTGSAEARAEPTKETAKETATKAPEKTPDKTARARVEGLYSDAAAALEREDPAFAAACYAEVLEVVPEQEGSHGSRVLALADALAAYRRAAGRSPSAEPLCAALALVRAYRDDLSAHYGPHAADLDGAMMAAAEENALVESLAQKNMSCSSGNTESDEPQETGPATGQNPSAEPVSSAEPATEGLLGPMPMAGLDPPPSFAEPARRGIGGDTLGGIIGLGVGGVLLGIMSGGLVVGARATRDAATLRAEKPSLTVDDSEFDEIIARGRRGDRAAIIAGVGAGVALAAAAVLIVIGRKRSFRRSSARISRAPRIEIGRAFVVRFGSP